MRLRGVVHGLIQEFLQHSVQRFQRHFKVEFGIHHIMQS